MRLIEEKLKELGFGWNERPLTEADLFRLCRRFKISVVEMPLRTDGFYYRVSGKDYIAVDSKLHPTKKLLVLFHELGHFLFHAPESGATANFHGLGIKTRKEVEADVFAICCLIPLTHLDLDALPAVDDEFYSDTLAKRKKIFELYGI
jgi:Zn-dependent peptidase ImmA (M78 family)